MSTRLPTGALLPPAGAGAAPPRGTAPNPKSRAARAGLLLLVSTLVTADYSIDWFTIDAGGGTSAGPTYELSGTIGQPDANAAAAAGGPFRWEGGFWPGTIVVRGEVAPTLFIESGLGQIRLTWLPASESFALEQTSTLDDPAWEPGPPGNPVTLPPTNASAFYRLRRVGTPPNSP